MKELEEKIKSINSQVELLSYYNKMKHCLDVEDYNKAIEIATLILEIDSNNKDACRILGLSNIYLKNYQGAISALQLLENDIPAMMSIGWCYYQLNDLDNAVSMFEKVIELDDTYEPAYEARNSAMIELKAKIIETKEKLKKTKDL